jgi:hypothetical protein
MTEGQPVERRTVVRAGLWGTLLVAVGGVVGWTASQRRYLFARAAKEPRLLDGRYDYDVSAFAKTDPALLLCRPDGQFAVDFKRVRRFAVAPDDRILVGGDMAIKTYGRDGSLRATLELPTPPHGMAFGADGRLFVALRDHVRVFDAAGRPVKAWAGLGQRAFLTAVAVAEKVVFLADAGQREVILCDHDGNVVRRFGKKGTGGDNAGFVVPSPYFHLAVGRDGLLRVNNPGRHKIETYSIEGCYESAWGKASFAADGFCGCCNPVYFALLPDGRVVTSEKGLTRVKVYDAGGKFLGFVAGPELLAGDMELAEQAAEDCRIGCGFDVAADSKGDVLVLDPKERMVRIFTWKTGSNGA